MFLEGISTVYNLGLSSHVQVDSLLVRLRKQEQRRGISAIVPCDGHPNLTQGQADAASDERERKREFLLPQDSSIVHDRDVNEPRGSLKFRLNPE